MKSPLRLAVLGDPLAFTRSPELHRAGAAALGMACESRAIRTPADQLTARLDALAAQGYRGVNLTMPLKERALACAGEVSARALQARSVNTITFAPGGRRGDSTDGVGLVDWLRTMEVPPGAALLLLGAGGAGRSAALAAEAAGYGVTLCARRPDEVEARWPEAARLRIVTWRDSDIHRALTDACVLVNATPLGTGVSPVAAAALPAGILVLDMSYGPEPGAWVSECRARGLAAHDGLGMLVHQARHSLSQWLEAEVPLEPLAQAVGWRP